MNITGLTGSIAMGKSYILKIFSFYKVPTFCSDDEIKELYNDQRIIKQISNFFPQALKGNKIDKRVLAEIVLNDKKNLQQLESILYPYLNTHINNFIKKMLYKRSKLIVLEIPLLFEKSYKNYFTNILLASCSNYLQEKRYLQRSGASKKLFKGIISKQFPVNKKASKADLKIYTGLGKSYSFRQIKAYLRTFDENNHFRYRNNWFRP